MPYKYIGRTTTFRGKTLWELLGNLKNFGVGRIVTRSAFERYPEPTYMKIVKVETLANPENPSMDNVRKCKVLIEKTFRGFKYEKLICLESASYKTDYRLIPKDEEADYCTFNGTKLPEKILHRTTPLPPLLRELLLREMKETNPDSELKEPEVDIVYTSRRNNRYRIAKQDEKPTEELLMGLGKPLAARLYNNIKM